MATQRRPGRKERRRERRRAERHGLTIENYRRQQDEYKRKRKTRNTEPDEPW